ncbi:MAG: hypothetical protein KGD59_07820 [Candidatus Heimdallarchaeota archaeon]|nr:hypothetical protein [Candidatus Heimdallarchaeota archaeon]MBY8994443.1 hypothetical protein [Candidatus Heimdallarchaeota archaeon]
METQDVIINKEKLVKTIYDLDSVKCLQDDKNCELLLNFLLDGPLTFEDIKDAFKTVNAQKSDKTIYGYLNRLKKANLVMEAGKRIITYSESHIKTLTLYSRTAKVFYIALDLSGDENEDKSDDYFNVIGRITCQLLNFKKFDEACFRKIYSEITKKKRIDIEEINNINNPEILDLVATFDVRATKYILDTVCWLAYVGGHPEIYQEMIKCFSK